MDGSADLTHFVETSVPEENGERVSTARPETVHSSCSGVPTERMAERLRTEGAENPRAEALQNQPGHGQCDDASTRSVLGSELIVAPATAESPAVVDAWNITA